MVGAGSHVDLLSAIYNFWHIASMVTLREARRQRALQLRSKTVFVNALRLLWMLIVLWCELGSFFWSIASCRWPDSVVKKSRTNTRPLHVLLVADPQVPRPYKGWPLGITWLKHYVVNLNLRKSWNAVKRLKPQVVVFLGDMLRHGSTVKDVVDYGDYFERFQSIFRLDPAIQAYYIPGNRDVGLGSSRTFSARARDRFEAFFGPINQQVDFGNHTFVLLDAPALVEEDYRRHSAQAKFSDWLGVSGGSIDFVKSVATHPGDLPVVLFTHIPLSRPDAASCGPLREHGGIRRGVGRGYQNLLGRETSNFVLGSILPSIVFSADDHDYCEYLHTVSAPDHEQYSVQEVTVKTFSMATRVRRPGFQLLSLFAPEVPSSDPTHANVPCLLPNQSRIYTHGYAPLICITIVLLLFFNLRRPRPLYLNGSHVWHEPIALHSRDSSSSGSSPGPPSPPASPIHYKPSRSQHPGLRSASTLTPNVVPSQPTTPLGGTPLLSASFRPPTEDDDVQEVFLWSGQTPSAQNSPFPPRDDRYGGDSSYFLPSPGARKIGMSKSSVWLPSLRGRTRLTVRPSYVSILSVPFVIVGRIIWYGGQRRARTPLGRFLQDTVHVAWPPVLVYIGVSLWLFR